MAAKVAVFAGSFAPFTNGHADILDRALGIFDAVVVLVTTNPEKNIPTKDLIFHASMIDSFAKEKYGDASTAIEYTMDDVCDLLNSRHTRVTNPDVIVVPRLDNNGVPIMVTEFAEQIGAVAMVRGIRNEADYCYEQNLVNVNSVLSPSIQTVWLPCDPRLACVSSTVVRSVLNMGGSIDNLVPTVIAKMLQPTRFTYYSHPNKGKENSV